MTTPALLSCHDSGREASWSGLDELTALLAFQAGFRCGRQRPLELGVRYLPAGTAMARRRPSLLRRLSSGVVGLLLSRKVEL